MMVLGSEFAEMVPERRPKVAISNVDFEFINKAVLVRWIIHRAIPHLERKLKVFIQKTVNAG